MKAREYQVIQAAPQSYLSNYYGRKTKQRLIGGGLL